MKYLKLGILVCFLLLFATCKKDDNEANIESTGTLTINEMNYDLVHGEIAASGEINPPGNVYGYLIYLMSSDLVENAMGPIVELHFWTDNSTNVQPGNYTYFSEASPDINTFIFGFYDFFRPITYDTKNYYKGVSGTIIVEKPGDYYTFTINIFTDRYENITMGETPTDAPIETNIEINCTFTGKLVRDVYFSK